MIFKSPHYYKKLINDLWIALRPLSLTLALGSTTTGILAAYKLHGASGDYFALKVALTTLAGLLAQSGANLINDYFEGSFRYHRKSPQNIRFLGATRSRFDILVFLLGLSCFGLAALIGLVLTYLSGIHLLWIGFLGVLGGYAYTGEPFVYKRKGLGVPLSFIIMGPLMVYGAYYVLGMDYNPLVIAYSLPISFLIPALMLSNEMRDFQRDKGLSLGTMSVRVGYTITQKLYFLLLLGCYAIPLLLVLLGHLTPWSLAVVLTLPLAKRAYDSVVKFEGLGIPNTNRLHLVYSLIYLASMFF